MNSTPIQNLLNRIDAHSDFAAKHDAFVAEALESSGTYQTDGADTFVIDLHGIRVTANSEASAHALWLRAASTKIDRQGGAA